MQRTRRAVRQLLVPLVPLVMVAGVTAACGGDDDEGDGDALAGDAPTTATSAAADTEDGGATEVVAVDYHFDGLPESIEAGTTLTMRNDSEQEVHEFVAFAIPPEETRSVDELVALPEEELFASIPGEPALVLVAPPGEEAMAIFGDGTLTPGRYLVACAIPTGADPDEFMRQAQASDGPPDVPGGPPHFTAGMYAELNVS